MKVPCCNATVWKADVLRRTGRGPTGFEMHYTKNQCKRPARFDGRCWQHRDKKKYSLESDFYHSVEVSR